MNQSKNSKNKTTITTLDEKSFDYLMERKINELDELEDEMDQITEKVNCLIAKIKEDNVYDNKEHYGLEML